MKTKTGMSIGLALTLVVGVFATMLALGLFTTTDVRAAAVGPVTVSHVPTITSPDVPNPVDATVPTAAMVTVKFTTTTVLAAEQTITIGFPDLGESEDDQVDLPSDGDLTTRINGGTLNEDAPNEMVFMADPKVVTINGVGISADDVAANPGVWC